MKQFKGFSRSSTTPVVPSLEYTGRGMAVLVKEEEWKLLKREDRSVEVDELEGDGIVYSRTIRVPKSTTLNLVWISSRPQLRLLEQSGRTCL